jgi:hypothetical protein
MVVPPSGDMVIPKTPIAGVKLAWSRLSVGNYPNSTVLPRGKLFNY